MRNGESVSSNRMTDQRQHRTHKKKNQFRIVQRVLKLLRMMSLSTSAMRLSTMLSVKSYHTGQPMIQLGDNVGNPETLTF